MGLKGEDILLLDCVGPRWAPDKVCQNASCVSGKRLYILPLWVVVPSVSHTKGTAGKGAITKTRQVRFLKHNVERP